MKRTFIFFVGVLAVLTAYAAPRSQEAARQVATQYFTLNSHIRRAPAGNAALQHAWTATQQDGAPAFYVFNRGTDGGFVIVSADDRARTVLAYADRGHFDAANMPVNVRSWLDGYSRAIHYAAGLPPRKASLKAKSAKTTTYTPVEPLCWTQWGQDYPYNMSCPVVGEDTCVTGCVATAAAQVMAYHRWPNQGKGSHSYGWERSAGDTVPLSVDFSQATYDWTLMDSSYNSQSLQSHREEVAKLMYHCGVACEMGYGVSASGAYFLYMMRGMIDNFSYDAGVRSLYKDYMGEQAFLESVNNDLQLGRPVYFSGRTIQNEGHAFICDGIDADGLLHINWGWNGYYDAYFQVSALDPEDQGIGGSSGNYAFTENVAAFSNIRPQATDVKNYTILSTLIHFDTTRIAREDNLVMYVDTFYNPSLYDWAGTMGLRVYQNDTLVGMYDGSPFSTKSSYLWHQRSAALAFDSLPEGDYEMVVSVSIDDQPGVYEPIYTLGIGEYRCPMQVTADSIIITLPNDTTPDDPVDPVDPVEPDSSLVITVGVNDTTLGYVIGLPDTLLYAGDTITLTALPKDSAQAYFLRWENDSTDNPREIVLTTDSQFVAIFALRTYTVMFYDEDSVTVLDSAAWAYGQLPTCDAPTKPADDEYSYKFVGWTPEVVPVVGDAKYYAVYEATPLDPVTHPLYDAKDADFIEDFRYFVLREAALADGNGWLTASNDSNAHLNLLVVLPTGATELTWGTYPVNGTGGPKTVVAGTGIGASGWVEGSYACYSSNSGAALRPLWYIVEGVMTVDPVDQSIDLEATNSYGRTIRCHILKWVLPVENVSDDQLPATKILRNGQILILRGGEQFDLTGRKVINE